MRVIVGHAMLANLLANHGSRQTQNGHNLSVVTVMPVLSSSGEKLRMHDLWVACSASCPHRMPFLHPLLHSPRGASMHPPRLLSLLVLRFQLASCPFESSPRSGAGKGRPGSLPASPQLAVRPELGVVDQEWDSHSTHPGSSTPCTQALAVPQEQQTGRFHRSGRWEIR